MSRRDISGWPVMASKCATCPFGPNGDQEIRATVESRALTASQICHHPRTKGKRETHLCRGSRDLQLGIMAALGVIGAPTDEAWSARVALLREQTDA